MPIRSASEVIAAIYTRTRTIFLVVGASMAIGWWLTGHITPLYKAQTTFYVPFQPMRLVLGSERASVPNRAPFPDATEQTHIGVMGLLKGKDLARRVVEKVNAAYPGVNFDTKRLTQNMILDVDRTRRLQLYFLDENPERAAFVANIYYEAFRDSLQDFAFDQVSLSLRVLRDRRTLLEEDLREAEEALRSYLLEHGLVDFGSERSALLSRRISIETEQMQIETENQELLASIRATEAALEGRPEYVLAERSLSRNPELDTLRTRLVELESEIAVQRLTYTDEHHAVAKLLAQQEQLVARLAAVQSEELRLTAERLRLDETGQTLLGRLTSYRVREASLAARGSVLAQQAAAVDAVAGIQPDLQIELSRLSRAMGQFQGVLNDVLRRIIELEVQLERPPTWAIQLEGDRATPERTSVVPDPTMTVVVAGIMGLVAGIQLALILELVSRGRRARPF